MSFSAQLRRELCDRNRAYARQHAIAFTESYGEAPVILYEPAERHGNFFEPSYRAIQSDPGWRTRLHKHHSQRKSLPRPENGHWRELDSSCSSDALLMNVFCDPATLRNRRLWSMLGIDPARPEFGVKARVPLVNGKFDRTEVDMRLGAMLFEAKLTEGDFQRREKSAVQCYRDFADVFAVRELPQTPTHFLSYQLIRNVLAAHALDCSFCVIADQRRPDLKEAWHAVMRAVNDVDLRLRCKMLTWQELAARTSRPMQRFLQEKYGMEREV
jgi:hypothetical protein